MNKGITAFDQSVQTISSFVTDDQWRASILVDVAMNPLYERWVVDTIQELLHKTPRNKKLNALLHSIRHECLTLLRKAHQESTPLDRWHTARLAYSHYAFLETIVEASVFSDMVVQSLKDALGASYLEKVTEVDRLKPSELTGADIPQGKTDGTILQQPEVEDYLVLKHWQDNQHTFHDEVLMPVFSQLRDEFASWMHQTYPETEMVNGMELIALGMIAVQPIVPLDQLARFVTAGIDKVLAVLVGGKALGLARLVATGANVPLTYVVTVPSIRHTSYTTALATLPNNKRWAVRSSATVEDGQSHSFAGMFESFLDISKDDIPRHIKMVAKSVSSKRVQAYVDHFGTNSPEMAAIIQEFEQPRYSGVWLGKGLTDGDLEWVEGTGDLLVSGHVKPHHENWKRKTVPAILLDGIPIGEKAIQLQEKLGAPGDFEWCILDGKLLWLQYRPVTKKVTSRAKVKSGKLCGVPASPGSVIGRAVIVDNPDNVKNWHDGDILVTEFTDPDWVPIMIRAAAVVTAEGGFLSHAAIIARELGIPCITRMEGALDIKSGTRIKVDGNRGVVTIL